MTQLCPVSSSQEARTATSPSGGSAGPAAAGSSSGAPPLVDQAEGWGGWSSRGWLCGFSKQGASCAGHPAGNFCVASACKEGSPWGGHGEHRSFPPLDSWWVSSEPRRTRGRQGGPGRCCPRGSTPAGAVRRCNQHSVSQGFKHAPGGCRLPAPHAAPPNVQSLLRSPAPLSWPQGQGVRTSSVLGPFLSDPQWDCGRHFPVVPRIFQVQPPPRHPQLLP